MPMRRLMQTNNRRAFFGERTRARLFALPLLSSGLRSCPRQNCQVCKATGWTVGQINKRNQVQQRGSGASSAAFRQDPNFLDRGHEPKRRQAVHLPISRKTAQLRTPLPAQRGDPTPAHEAHSGSARPSTKTGGRDKRSATLRAAHSPESSTHHASALH